MTTFLSPDAMQDYGPYTLFIQPYREATDNWNNGISYYSGASIGMRVAHIVIGTLLFLPVINTIVLIALRLFNSCGRSYSSYVPQTSYGGLGTAATSVVTPSPFRDLANLPNEQASQPYRSKFAMQQQPATQQQPAEEEEGDMAVNPPGGPNNLSEEGQIILNCVEESVKRNPEAGLCSFRAKDYIKVLEILKERHPNLVFSYGDEAYKWKFLGPVLKIMNQEYE
jgi:hypothetical protein